MYGRQHVAIATRNAFEKVYGSPLFLHGEPAQILRDVMQGCVLAFNGSGPECSTIRVKQDGHIEHVITGPRGGRKAVELKPADLALVIGKISGFENELETLSNMLDECYE